MTFQERIRLVSQLGEYMLSKDPTWEAIKDRAYRENQWFIPEFIELAVSNIATHFLKPSVLETWTAAYDLPAENTSPKTVGIVMAGNIPLVGFHDLLSVFISGHTAVIKASSKDEILIKHLVQQLYAREVTIQNDIAFADQLKNCDAYIATGSNNSSRYFDYYFGKYPHIIRRNRTSVAVLSGNETAAQLSALAADIQQYFGLGCRNITQLIVPANYDFKPLLEVLKQYAHFMDYHKYKHNYDYHLALLIMGGKYYMTNDSIILTENNSPFSPVSQVHYKYYTDRAEIPGMLEPKEDIQCIVGEGYLAFGEAQRPSLFDYPDGVDTMAFLKAL
ncbi:MAG: acyl-CoA reductase [Chitinophagaceae bacterium]|nr:acyl-CoA reductase [Chitinophagaceae bacterium]